MNEPNQLRDELTRRSQVMAESELDFDAMRGQARGIRRRRRIGTGLAAAAVLAVIAVPTALVVDDVRQDSAPGPAEGTSQVPDPDRSTPAPDDDQNGQTGTHLADDKEAAREALENLPTTDTLTVAYLRDGVVHLADGTKAEAPRVKGPVSAIAGYHGGWLVAEQGASDVHADATVHQYDAAGAEVGSTPGNDAWVTSNDGTRLAWWTWNTEEQVGELHSGLPSGMGEGDGTVQQTGDAYVVPVGYLPSGELVYGATRGSAGQVARATDFAGNVRTIEGLASVTATDQINNRIAGQASDAQGAADGSRAVVADGTTGAEIWHKDGWMLDRFSPDGQHVIGYQLGADPLKVAILDAADGSVVSEVDLHDDHGLGYTDVVWNDDSSLAIAAYVFAGTDAEPHPGALLVLDTQGNLSRATDVDDGDGTWVFLPTS